MTNVEKVSSGNISVLSAVSGGTGVTLYVNPSLLTMFLIGQLHQLQVWQHLYSHGYILFAWANGATHTQLTP
jgi:hypothetical protein